MVFIYSCVRIQSPFEISWARWENGASRHRVLCNHNAIRQYAHHTLKLIAMAPATALWLTALLLPSLATAMLGLASSNPASLIDPSKLCIIDYNMNFIGLCSSGMKLFSWLCSSCARKAFQHRLRTHHGLQVSWLVNGKAYAHLKE